MIPKTPILQDWAEAITFDDDDPDHPFLPFEAVLRVQRECEDISVMGLRFLKDITKYYLEAKHVQEKNLCFLFQNPEEEEESHVCSITNGNYCYEEKKIILYPFTENFSFPHTYGHEMIHALEDTYCSLQSVRDVLNQLSEHKELHTKKQILACAQELIGLPILDYENEDTSWSLLQHYADNLALQDENGNFLYPDQLLFVEFSAFAFEFCSEIWNESKSISAFDKKLIEKWARQRKENREKKIYQAACRLIYVSMRSLYKKLKQWAKRRRWIRCLDRFAVLLEKESETKKTKQ